MLHGTLPETNIAHENFIHPKRKLVFQPSIFRCHVSFREGKLFKDKSCIDPLALPITVCEFCWETDHPCKDTTSSYAEGSAFGCTVQHVQLFRWSSIFMCIYIYMYVHIYIYIVFLYVYGVVFRLMYHIFLFFIFCKFLFCLDIKWCSIIDMYIYIFIEILFRIFTHPSLWGIMLQQWLGGPPKRVGGRWWALGEYPKRLSLTRCQRIKQWKNPCCLGYRGLYYYCTVKCGL